MTTPDSIPLKRCSKCGETLPATPEYFYRRMRVKIGLEAACKKCNGGRFGVGNKERDALASIGLKKCSKCGQIYPSTPEHFNRHVGERDGLRSSCRVCTSQEQRQKYATNPAKERERDRRRRAASPEKTREIVKRWQRKNPDKVRVFNHNYRSRKRALPSTFTIKEWQECLEWWNNTCAYCGAQQSFWHKLEQDHVIAITAGGGYTVCNILPACKSCNAQKQDQTLSEWVNRKFPKKAKQILARIAAYFEWVEPQEE